MRDTLPADWREQILDAYITFNIDPVDGVTEFGVRRWLEALHPRGDEGLFTRKPRAQFIKELPRHQQGLARDAARHLPSDETDIVTDILSGLHDFSPTELELAAALVRSMETAARRRRDERGKNVLRELKSRIRVESHARQLEEWRYTTPAQGPASGKELEKRRRARLTRRQKAKEAYNKLVAPPTIVGRPIRVLPDGEMAPFSAAPVLSGEQLGVQGR